jgi:hypothetical protein
MAVGLATSLLLLAAFAQSSAAQSKGACAIKPGDPDRGAILQYCPAQVKKAQPEAVGTTAGGPGGTTTGGALPPGGSPSESSKDGGAEIPLTDYPSSGGVNALLIVLLVAIAISVAYGARRWRRGSAEAP